MNNDFAPGLERFHARSFVCFDFIVSPTDIGPIMRGKPANGQTVDKYMRLLAQIENGNRPARSPQQELKTIGRELSSARSMEIGMLLNSGWRILFLTGVCVILGAREQPTD